MSKIVLRDYQAESKEKLRQGIREGHRSQILMAPAGAGKTEIASSIIEDALSLGSRAAFIVDRIVLANQTSARFDKYGIPHGVIQSGHWRNRPGELIQVCSAQTLEARGFFPDLKLLIVDESHCVRKNIADFIQNTSAKVIGLSATPFSPGLGELYSNLVNVTTTNALIADNWLSPLRVYVAKAADMTGAKIVAGEWSDSEVEKRGMEIVGDIVAEWVAKTHQHFNGPAKTIVFSATVDHGDELCRQFQQAGYNFQQISYKTPDRQREAMIQEFEKDNSEIHGLISCEVFTKGFDCPSVRIGISARPYRKSLSSHIQQLGRVMRPAPWCGKEYGVWLCHSNNYLRFKKDVDRIFEHGLDALPNGELEREARKEPTEKEKKQLLCSACGYVMESFMDRCPACGKERHTRSLVEVVPGKMVSLTAEKEKKLPAYLREKDMVWAQICTNVRKSKSAADKPDEFILKRSRFLYHSIYGEWPESKSYHHDVFVEPKVSARIRHVYLKHAKSRGYQWRA